MSERVFNILFLCTGNSARSILAEAYLNSVGQGRFRAYSAGSHPTGRVNPFALELLERHGIPSEGLHSKAWDEFARPGASQMDFVITVCDSAAGEMCPVWPGRPATAHWGVEDPAAVTGNDEAKRQAFTSAFSILKKRIDSLVTLPLGSLDPKSAQEHLKRIGKEQ